MNQWLAGSAALLVLLILSTSPLSAQSRNGFDLSNTTIPSAEILRGGPPRDGIPAIDHPIFVAPPMVDYLRDDDLVISFVRGGVARAYPLRILVWHEIVNDVINGERVVVTYCPLCGTAMVFSAEAGGEQRRFGVSGLLYQSDVLMYDRETESLWSQLAMRAVSGPAAGTQLTWLPSDHLTWKAWRETYPTGEVLSPDTGYKRNYSETAYASYFSSGSTLFPVPQTRAELPNKEWVLGVLIDGHAKAYAVNELPDGQPVRDLVNGTYLTILWNSAARRPSVRNDEGTLLPSVMAFWFAWQAFYPETELWKP